MGRSHAGSTRPGGTVRESIARFGRLAALSHGCRCRPFHRIYADFSLTGKAYLPFPDPRTFRIRLEEVAKPEIRERLRAVWLDPHSLDPARERARVTREVAGKLAVLARNLELKYKPKEVAEFLTRCIFTSFAEDVGLLPERSWLNLLESLHHDVANFPPIVESLWKTMNEGGFSPILRRTSSSSMADSSNPPEPCPSPAIRWPAHRGRQLALARCGTGHLRHLARTRTRCC